MRSHGDFTVSKTEKMDGVLPNYPISFILLDNRLTLIFRHFNITYPFIVIYKQTVNKSFSELVNNQEENIFKVVHGHNNNYLRTEETLCKSI